MLRLFGRFRWAEEQGRACQKNLEVLHAEIRKSAAFRTFI